MARAASLAAPFAPYEVDWGAFAPLKLRARLVAEGIYAGSHRSIKKGAGVEFGGTRPYLPGDDLRFFDRRSLLLHDRLMVREFETETDRALWLVVDATASMGYRGDGPGAKYAFAALLAASLAKVALSAGDPVGLVILGGEGATVLPARAGRESFDRIVHALSTARVAGDLASDDKAFERPLGPVADKARRGAIIVLFSDLFDLPERALRSFASLAVGGRIALAVEVLDPAERELPFHEHSRFTALEGGAVVDADPDTIREAYRKNLESLEARWETELVSRGGALVRSTTHEPPVAIVRSVAVSLRARR